jgi:aldose 1-epimerase
MAYYVHMKIARDPYGTTSYGKAIDKITLENSSGYSVEVITYGAYLISFKGPDRDGRIEELTKAFPSLSDYEVPTNYHGATIGRYANRIGGSSFTLDGELIELVPTHDMFQLHGGPSGFNTRIWEAFPMREEERASVKLTLTSAHGDQGYPGTLDVALTITLTEKNELFFVYEAVTDRPTCVSLTNHTYWNLSGKARTERVLDQLMQIHAEHIVEVDSDQVPTGRLIPVAGTPFDFREPKPIGEDITRIDADPQGYDHNFVLADHKGVLEAAVLKDPSSGRVMKVLTNAPGLQFYTDNYSVGNEHTALCLEAGELPDAMNHEGFHSPVLRPGETYRQVTIHSFSVER